MLAATAKEPVKMDLLSVSEVARKIGARPRDISDLFYRRELGDEKAPIVGGRRMISPSFLPVVEMVLRRNGRSVRESQGAVK